MDNKYDIVIIGAGIAGLVAGNCLLDRGKRVLIVERSKYPGGCACSFGKKGFRFDAAVHWISQAGEGGIVRRIMDEFGLGDKVCFERLPRPARIMSPDRSLDLEFGKEGMAGTFKKAFPAESAGIDKFWDEVERTKAQLWRLIMSDSGKKAGLGKALFNLTFPLKFGKIAKYHKAPASDVIRTYFKDEALCDALMALGIFPGISFVHYAWFNSVTLDGDAYYPRGGIQAVPDALAARFIENGGEIMYRSVVEKIIIKDGSAAGVRLAGGDETSAGTVISAGDARNTFLNMVGEEYLPEKFVSGLKAWKPSESFFYVYLGIDMDLKARGFDGSPIWYFPKEVDTKEYPMLGGKAMGIGMPSVLDPSLAPPGKSVVIIGMLASCMFMKSCPVRMEGEGGKEMYYAVKDKIANYLIDIAGEAIPGLKDKIEIKIAATPHTFERYTMNYLGASSGWSMAAEHQHKLPIKTTIKGLYLAGHWTMNPGGVPAAFISGKMAADEII